MRIHSLAVAALGTGHLGPSMAFRMLPLINFLFPPKNEGRRQHHGALLVCCFEQLMLLHAQCVQSRAVFPNSWTWGLRGEEISASSRRLWDVVGAENILMYIYIYVFFLLSNFIFRPNPDGARSELLPLAWRLPQAGLMPG